MNKKDFFIDVAKASILYILSKRTFIIIFSTILLYLLNHPEAKITFAVKGLLRLIIGG
jgi:hypothetical protein